MPSRAQRGLPCGLPCATSATFAPCPRSPMRRAGPRVHRGDADELRFSTNAHRRPGLVVLRAFRRKTSPGLARSTCSIRRSSPSSPNTSVPPPGSDGDARRWRELRAGARQGRFFLCVTPASSFQVETRARRACRSRRRGCSASPRCAGPARGTACGVSTPAGGGCEDRKVTSWRRILAAPPGFPEPAASRARWRVNRPIVTTPQYAIARRFHA